MSQLKDYRVITALITPFTEQGEIDQTSLKKLVRQQEQADNLILLLGSTGEGLALSLTDKKAVIDYVFSLQPKVPVMISVSGFQLEEQVAWVRYCQENYPICGFLLLTPFYAKPGVKGQIAWFNTLMDTAKKPCVLYNVPGRSAVKLYPEALKSLLRHPQFAGLKEASGDFREFSHYQSLLSEHLLYSGNDELLAEQVKRKAFGIISVAANIWPHETKLYLELCLKSKNSTELDALWEQASQALFMASNPIPLKVLLYREGLISSPVLRAPLTHEELDEAQVQTLLELSQRIRQHPELHP